jgi:hypothetical protein
VHTESSEERELKNKISSVVHKTLAIKSKDHYDKFVNYSSNDINEVIDM